MNELVNLEQYFLPLSHRVPPEPLFFRVIGHDQEGKIQDFLKRYWKQAQSEGIYLDGGINNPTEQEIERFYSAVGPNFILTEPLISRHVTVWLGHLRPEQRGVLVKAVAEELAFLRSKNINEGVVKNTYVKYLCWFRSVLSRVLRGIGNDPPPKVLFEGEISKYEVYLLHLLHRAGCDVLYFDGTTEERYRKTDASSSFSKPVYGALKTPLVPHFTAGGADKPSTSPRPVPRAPSPQPAPPKPVSAGARPAPRPAAPSPAPSWKNERCEIVLNSWAKGDWWEDALAPPQKRGQRDEKKRYALFLLILGMDERAAYRNRLFSLRRSLEASGRKWLLLDRKIPNPSAAEAETFRTVDKSAGREEMICALTSRIKVAGGVTPTALLQRAFSNALDGCREGDPVRLFNYGVRLACWAKRYGDPLFERWGAGEVPAFVYYGPITEPEITLLWVLANAGADVVYLSPDKAARAGFEQHPLPKAWKVLELPDSSPVESFPEREERLRATTTAYNASRELDELLYSDTGMFRDRQFVRSVPVTLKTTYDEVGILWKEEAKYRPSFETEAGIVHVPNLFVKISGVEKGDLNLYWEKIRSMVTEDTYLATTVPFLRPNGPSMSSSQAERFLHNGKLDPKALKASPYYRYDYLPEDTQDYLLEKAQALMDYDLLLDKGPGLYAILLSVLTNLDKELLKRIQNFDFTKEIPKFIVVDTVENVFSLEECILIAFLNLIGFDVAVFTPTGYRNLEKHLRPDSFETHTVGEFLFDLAVPNLRVPHRQASSGGWLSSLFGGGKG